MYLKDDYVSVGEKRVQAYEAFRKFSRDASQEGDTLNSSAPVKFSGTKSLIAKRAYLARLAYRPETKVSAISLLMPTELCWASGYVPFNWEMFASLLASHSKVIELTNTGSVPVPRCSFINALVGAKNERILPVPDVSISSSAFCEGIAYGFNEVTKHFNVPHFHIDIPGYTDTSAISYLAEQLKDVYFKISEKNDISRSKAEENIRQTVYNSTVAKEIYLDICRIREELAPLNLGLEPLHWHSIFMGHWGDEAAIQICRKLKMDIQKYIADKQHLKEDGIPVAMFSLIPYGRTNIWNKLNDAKAFMSFEGVNYLGEIELLKANKINKYSIDDLFKNMAVNLIKSPMRGIDMDYSMNTYMDRAKKAGSDGLIIFSHEHCQMLAPRLKKAEEKAASLDMKVVSISGDCILGMPQGPTGIRLGTFLNALQEDKHNEALGIEGEDLSLINNFTDVKPDTTRVGVDFGSGYSKYLVLDELNDILEYGVVTSGIDYPKLLEDIKKKLNTHGDLKYGIAGVGGDNPMLQSLVDGQTTEISALIKAVKYICQKETNFLVIDIGTQDVKILEFENHNSNPWINTNKSCGAGTGMVLASILERWQQTNSEMKFTDLDDMAYNAKGGELINTTCGIFAVTNVVSALVQSTDEKRGEILLGVYNYIATQAIKLLPKTNHSNKSLVLTGGIANHRTLRRIFEDKGFNLVELPKNLHPQFVVAFGTALSM